MKAYEALQPRHLEFIGAQHMFFVASAPLTAAGHVNLSPKGYDSFAVLGERRVAYIDLGGSGIETHAHVRENGRLTFMWCSFGEVPLILRVYGRGLSHAFGSPEFNALRPHFAAIDVPVRGIIEVEVTRVQESCGWGVPLYEFRGQRPTLGQQNARRTQDEYTEHRLTKNGASIDGLPGLRREPV